MSGRGRDVEAAGEADAGLDGRQEPAAFFLFFPNAARDTMLLVTLWNITLRFTGVVGPAARISLHASSPTIISDLIMYSHRIYVAFLNSY